MVTGKAHSEIRKFVRTQERSEYINLGRAILTKTFRAEGVDFTEKLLEPHLPYYNKKNAEDVIAEVGEGLISRQQLTDMVIGQKKSILPNAPSLFDSLAKPFRKKKTPEKLAGKTSAPMPIKGLISGMAIHFAGCCHPIPGDKIVGIVTTGKGITIHTMDCETLENYSDSPERWIDVAWEHEQNDASHTGRIRLQVSNEPASLATVTNVIASENGNISNFKIINRSMDFFELLIDIEVRNVRHLSNIIANLRSKQVVQNVDRWQS